MIAQADISGADTVQEKRRLGGLLVQRHRGFNAAQARCRWRAIKGTDQNCRDYQSRDWERMTVIHCRCHVCRRLILDLFLGLGP